MSSSPTPPPTELPPNPTTQRTLPILTNHCRFCNHLLLATTQTVSALARRKEPARDGALILPLPSPRAQSNDTEPSDEKGQEGQGSGSGKPVQQQYSILLSTAVPDRRATMVRREDGFEKRWFLRCGRCRVVVGYFLDAVHFPNVTAAGKEPDGEDEDVEAERAKVVYLLPGALVETDDMGDPEKMKAIDREWAGWLP
ncbi:uncharacterized protein LDX57_001445 [Aspergillus melleus]|uniref:uncharacterized protein n=1 Tax=Aspergillus melleus TaxID=138277 RepID=UPI001E8E061B|nr:uncharacterized protein LDX57_001445 [Aspergillus melleus]KAH8423688.1 hypothetical protein LDX57_001445 [Aspergillus melleus]